MSVKASYVAVMRGARAVADRLGFREPAPGERGFRAHLRSLLGIHDVNALIQWDVPWWTYRAVDAVDEFLVTRARARVFEYGAGASTVWLARRAAEVHTVEHDLGWAESLRTHLDAIPNVTMHVVPPTKAVGVVHAPSGRKGYAGVDFSDYVNVIDAIQGNFDLIVIDGRARMACLEHAVQRLSPGGLVVVDNSHRRRYRDVLRSVPADIERFRGAAPGLPYLDETALLQAPTPRTENVPAPRIGQHADTVQSRTSA